MLFKGMTFTDYEAELEARLDAVERKYDAQCIKRARQAAMDGYSIRFAHNAAYVYSSNMCVECVASGCRATEAVRAALNSEGLL